LGSSPAPTSPLFSPIAVLRALARLVLLLALIVLAWVWHAMLVRRQPTHREKANALWLQRLCGKVALLLSVRVEVVGAIPSRGLIVANHLSYLDIILLGAVVGPIFVSKAEVTAWPIFGRCARWAGTIFINRERRGDVVPVAAEMRRVLTAGVPLVLFPEGTSSGGETVLPFRPALFAPVPELDCPVAACAIDYALPSGSVAQEVAYWGDHKFAPHLLNLLGKNGLRVRIAFGPSLPRTGDRKAIARELHSEICSLRQSPSL
jgi:1-acyl-sn-glycerol-3-phosphate acyltransferase